MHVSERYYYGHLRIRMYKGFSKSVALVSLNYELKLT